MSRGKKTGGKDFQKGNPGGPGRPPLSLEAREFRKATKQEITDEFRYLWSLSETDLRGIVLNEEAHPETGEKLPLENDIPIIRKVIAKAILKAADTGSMFDLNQILDRVIGKVKEEIDLNHKGSLHMQVVTMIMEAEGKEIANGDKGKAQIENQKANDKEA